MEQNDQGFGSSSCSSFGSSGSCGSGIPGDSQQQNQNSQGFVPPVSNTNSLFGAPASNTNPFTFTTSSGQSIFTFPSSSGSGQSNTNNPPLFGSGPSPFGPPQQVFGTGSSPFGPPQQVFGSSPFGTINPFGSWIPDPQQNSSGVGQFNTTSHVFQPARNPFSSQPPTFRDPFSSQPVNNVADFHDDEDLPKDQPAPTLLPNSSSALKNLVIQTSTEFPALAASDSYSSFAVLLGIRAPPLPSVEAASDNQRVPVDLVAVLDISGSMAGKKLSLLKFATKFVIDHMLPCDRLSIVVFSTRARRILPLRRMTESGRKVAEFAVDSLVDEDSTNIVDGLNMGAQVLEQRRQRNPVSSIIFLSDGQDNINSCYGGRSSNATPGYLQLLSPSISSHSNQNQTKERFPVYSFGLGMDHDAVAMNAIADGSCGGTFSFVEFAEMIPKSFARCIGGLFSVVAQDVRVTVSSASAGVEIKSIPSGRHKNEIVCRNKQGIIHVGDLFADEKKDFLVYLSVPVRSLPSVDNYMDTSEDEATLSKTALVDIHCYYCNAFTEEIVKIDGPRIEIRRPITVSAADKAVDLKVDGQKNRVAVSESIAKAKEMADKGNLAGAKEVLTGSRDNLLASASAQAGAEIVNWLEAELKEITARMESMDSYERHGRAFMNAGLSAHGAQRASTRNYTYLEASACAFGASGSDLKFASFGAAGGAAFDTPMMAQMQSKVQMPNPFEPIVPQPTEPKKDNAC